MAKKKKVATGKWYEGVYTKEELKAIKKKGGDNWKLFSGTLRELEEDVRLEHPQTDPDFYSKINSNANNFMSVAEMKARNQKQKALIATAGKPASSSAVVAAVQAVKTSAAPAKKRVTPTLISAPTTTPYTLPTLLQNLPKAPAPSKPKSSTKAPPKSKGVQKKKKKKKTGGSKKKYIEGEIKKELKKELVQKGFIDAMQKMDRLKKAGPQSASSCRRKQIQLVKANKERPMNDKVSWDKLARPSCQAQGYFKFAPGHFKGKRQTTREGRPVMHFSRKRGSVKK